MIVAYRIDYAPKTPDRRTGSAGIWRLQTMTAVFLLVFTLLVSCLWPEGTQKLRQYLLPGENAVQTAFVELAAELREGQSLEASLTTFCRQIIENEKLR